MRAGNGHTVILWSLEKRRNRKEKENAIAIDAEK